MSSGLTQLAPGVYVWLGGGTFGEPNAGVVIDHDGITLVDTLTTPAQAEPFAEAVEAFGYPTRRVVLTSSHIPFVGGTSRFWQAAFYGTQHTSDLLDLPPNVEGYRRMLPAHATAFDDEFATRPVSHTVGTAVQLTDAVVAVPTAGQSPGNLVVQVPGADVVFCGAMASFGTTPLAFDGDPRAWAEALRSIAELGSVFVPGHGPVGTADDLHTLADYLEATVSGSIPAGPWDRWSNRAFDEINLERAAILAAGDDRPPLALLRWLGLA